MSKHRTINGNRMTTTLGDTTGTNVMPSFELPRLKVSTLACEQVIPTFASNAGDYPGHMAQAIIDQSIAKQVNPICLKCPNAEKLSEKTYQVNENVEKLRTTMRCKLLRSGSNVICPDEGEIKMYSPSREQFFYQEFPIRVSKAPQIQRHRDEPTSNTAGDW